MLRKRFAFLLCLGFFSASVELLLDRGIFTPAAVAIVHNDTAKKRGTFVLHVGPHKTGTTSIQASLHANPALRDDSYVFIGKYSPYDRAKSRQSRPLIQFRRLFAAFRVRNSKEFFKILRERLKDIPIHNNVICSAEEFSLMLHAVDQDGTPFFTLLKEELKDWNIHVVVGYRRHFEWIVSLYNQKQREKSIKNKRKKVDYGESLVESLVDWYRSSDSFLSQFQNDCLHVYQQMQRHFDNVSILNFHSDFLTSLYCVVLPNASRACEWYKNQIESSKLTMEHANPSVPWLGPMSIATKAQWRGIHVKKEDIIEFAARTNYTFPVQCLEPQEQQNILNKSFDFEKAVVPEFFKSPMGKAELRKEFEKAVLANKFCSVDSARVFQDERWVHFFRRKNVEGT